jgi:hypothetical protein
MVVALKSLANRSAEPGNKSIPIGDRGHANSPHHIFDSMSSVAKAWNKVHKVVFFRIVGLP